MRKNNIILILLVGVIIAFSGCASNSDAKQSGILGGIGVGSSSSSNSDGGVVLSFAENNPQSNLIKGSSTNFVFIFNNYQKHDITDLKLRTKGFDRSFVSGLAKDYTVSSIPKATTQSGAGVYTGLQVSGVVVDGFSNKFLFNPTFEYCYTATTTYQEQVCVPSKKNQCNLKVDSSIKSNGPVKVKLDRINSIGDKIRIDFSLNNNQAQGKVVNSCFKIDDYSNDYQKPIVKLGTIPGDCKAVSGFKLNNGNSNFYCEFPRNSNQEYASQISVDFDYKYNQQIQKQIIVEDLNYN